MNVPRALIAPICAMFAALACTPALAVNDLTVTGSPTSVSGTGADSTVVTARAPVMNAGIVQQEITQAIDPARLRVTGLAGITYPFGWTPTFSTDGNTFGPAPTTAAGWGAIRAVKASGPIDSQGSYNGRQIATGAGTEVSPTGGSFVSSGGASGDGWDVFFDDQNHVFNVFHHDWWPNGRVDCHMRTGASCGPGWPFTIRGSTSDKSTGAVDNRYRHLWVPTATPTSPDSGAPVPVPAGKAGFVCVDIADFATGPRFCQDTFDKSFIAMAPSAQAPRDYNQVHALAVIGSRMFSLNYSAATGSDPSVLLCVDVHANGGLGATCPGSPVNLGTNLKFQDSVVKASQGRLYVVGYKGGIGQTGHCLVPSTLAACPGWETPKTMSLNTGYTPLIYEQPSVAGLIEGICFKDPGGATTACFKEDGTTLTPHAGLKSFMTTNWLSRTPDTVGTRVYYGENTGALKCFDVAQGAGGASCTGWPVSSSRSYTLVADPYNANCVWRNGDDGVIRAYNADGQVGCTSPPPWAELQADAIVPRMACADSGAVREWRSFQLTGPPTGTYSSATLTVYTAGGRLVSSGGTLWKDVPIPAGTLTVDLSSLAVADTGADPTFRVTFTGRSTWDNVSAKVTAVGDAPELCVTYAAESVCPIAPAQMPSGPFSAPFVAAVAATGSATLSGSGQAPFGPGSADITVGAAADGDCLGTISGTTNVGSSSGAAAVGVPVRLKDAAGNVIASTTTDASGNYSFGRLAAGSGYRVEFGGAGGYAPTTTTANSSGTDRSVTVGGVTDVDGLYSTVMSAPTRSATFPAAGGAFDPFAAAGSSPPATTAGGQVFTAVNKAATRLCDPTTTPPQDGTTVPCTLTSRTTAEGVWSVNTNTASADVGKVTFTPANGFSGAAPAQTYSVTDGTNRAVGSLTPTIVGAPTATDNTSTGAYNTPQQINVLGNDTAAQGATLAAGTLKLCDVAPNAQTPPNCDKTSVTTSEGTYAVVNGEVRFTPVDTFTGAAQTPVRYQVADSAGQVANALITPSVTAPTPPTASPQSAPVAPGIAKPFTTLTGASGLATQGGAAFDTSATCLVDPAAPNTCGTSITIQGEGTWTLDPATGVASFTALQGATGGQAAQVTYRVFDKTGQSATSTLTPTLVGPPSATDNTSSGAYNTPQQINVLGNDSAASGASLAPGTLKLCAVAPNAQTPPNCDKTSVATSEGTYAVVNGQVTFTPLDTFTGQATVPVTYQVKDTANQVVSALITPSVNAPAPPTASPGTATVAPGIPKAFTTTTGTSGLATTGGADFDTTRSCLVDPATPGTCATSLTTTQGTWTLDRASGIATFTANASGLTPGALNSVTYRVFDKTGQSVDSTLTPALVGPPTATDNTSSGAWNTPQQINVLANDTAAQGAQIAPGTLALCEVAPNAQTPPNCNKPSVTTSEGTYAVAGGQVTFTPLATFTGQATVPVTYQVSDSANQVVSALITPSVTTPPSPTAAPEEKLLARGASAAFTTLTGVSGLATSGGPSFTTSSTCLIAPGTSTCAQGTTLAIPGEGTWSLDQATGIVTFTADQNASPGALTPVGYRVTDALGRTADSTLTPRVLAAPQATDNATTAVWNTPVVIDPLANDQADPATALNPTTVKLCAISPTPETPPNCTQASLVVAGEGTYVVDPFTGKITFTPDPSFTGDATPVRYQVADGAGQTTSARITLSVSPMAPTASGASATVPAGGSATLRPSITPGTWPIDPAKTCLTTGTTCAPGATTLTLPEGTYVLDPATGLVTFTAAQGFSGPAPNPPMVMFTDMGGQSVMAPLAVSVEAAPPASVPPSGSGTPLQAAPIALADVESTGPGQPVTLQVLLNDAATGAGAFDPATLMLKDPATGRYSKTVTIPGQGTFRVNADGTVTFTPAPGFIGTTKALPYKVADALGRTTSSTLQVIVQQGEPPWADPDYAQGPAGTPLVMSPLANDDSGPSPFDPASLRLRDPATGTLVTRLSIRGEGTYVVDPSTGTVTFTPVKGFAGKATPVRYRVRTTANRPAEGTLNVHITSPGPALQIRTRTSRPVLKVGQTTTITLKIGNAGGQMARGIVTKAAIPRGFSVVNPMGGTVRDGYIYFRTGNLKAGGQTTRRFVLVAGRGAVGAQMAVYGKSRGSNVGPVADPAMIRVVAPSSTGPARVTG